MKNRTRKLPMAAVDRLRLLGPHEQRDLGWVRHCHPPPDAGIKGLNKRTLGCKTVVRQTMICALERDRVQS